MTKYANVQSAVFSVFTGVWTTEGVKTFPQDSVISAGIEEFLRVSIVASGPGLNFKSVSGVILVEIFTPSGKGPNRATVLADKLDIYLSGKTFTDGSGNATQLFSSGLVNNGLDADNPRLARSTFSIPFNYYGKQ